MSNSITTDVTLTYSHGIIVLKGKGISANVHIASSELTNMYWGKQGTGKLEVTIDETPTANSIY